MKISLKLLALSAIAVLSLTGCSNSSKPEGDNLQSALSTGYLVTLNDGRTVECVVHDGQSSGDIDCNWPNAQNLERPVGVEPENAGIYEVSVGFVDGNSVTCVEFDKYEGGGTSCEF